MGHGTRFTGQFNLDKTLTLEQYNILKDFANADHRNETGVPGNYCGWEPTRDGKAIVRAEHDFSFYDYDDWLKYLIVRFFEPWEYTLNGSVRWQGEETGDTGTLACEGNRVTMLKDEDIREQIERVRDDLLAWAGMHQDKCISESAMPRFREIMDRLERLTGWD
jgi:hypothetical protein